MELHNTLETFEHGGRTVVLLTDLDPVSPDEWPSAGNLVMERPLDSRMGQVPGAEERAPMGRERADDWNVDARYLRRHLGAVVLPLERYHESGLRIARDFDDAEGIIYASAEEIRREWDTNREAAETYLRASVSELNQYLEGEVFGYVVYDEAGNHLDSCWGFYGMDHVRHCAREAAEEHRAPAGAELAVLLLPMEVNS